LTKVLVKLFQKLAGLGGAHKTPFLFDNFFFAAHTVKEKVAKKIPLVEKQHTF